MPVAVNEPMSFLQRMVEYLEYAELLVAASQTDDSVHRLEVSSQPPPSPRLIIHFSQRLKSQQ